MEHLRIKLSPKQVEEQQDMIKYVRTHLMMFSGFMREGHSELARAQLNAAVTIMDIMAELRKTYAKDNTKTYIAITPEKAEQLEKTKRLQLWKKAA